MADTKITQLATLTSLSDADLILLADNVATTPVNKSARLDSLAYYVINAEGVDGAVGDGTTDDTTALAAAFTQSKVSLRPGATYRITAQIDVDHPVIIEGNGATIIADFGESGSAYCLRIAGEGLSGASTTATDDLVKSQRDLPVTSATGFSVGDVIEIVSTEYFNGIDGVSGFGLKTKGELNRIRAISGNDITLDKALADSYTLSGNTITVARREHISGVRVKNLKFYGTGGGNAHGAGNPTGARALSVTSADDVLVEGCSFDNFPRFGLIGDHCTNMRVLGCQIDGYDISDSSNSPSISLWFTGAAFFSCDGVVFIGNTGRNMRRPFDADSVSGNPVCRNLVVTGNTSENCLNMIGTHACENALIANNIGINSGGIIFRGVNATIKGNVGTLRETSTYCFAIGQTSGPTLAYSEDSPVGHLKITGNQFTGTDGNPTYGAFIRGNVSSLNFSDNTMPRSSSDCVQIIGKELRNIRIEDNDLSAASTTTGGVIHIPNYNNLPVEVLDGLTINGNRFIGGQVAVKIGGSSVESPANNIRISDNEFSSCSVAYIRFTMGSDSNGSNGKFGPNRIVSDNIYNGPTPSAGDINDSSDGRVAFTVSGSINSGNGVREIRPGSAEPAGAVTYLRGMYSRDSAPEASGDHGWQCVSSGTAGTLSGVTGAITSGQATLTVNDIEEISVGTYLTVTGSGMSSAARVISMAGMVCTMSENAASTVGPTAAVAYTAPVFKTFGEIAA